MEKLLKYNIIKKSFIILLIYLIRRESISKTSIDTKGFLYWFESLRGRGNIRPTTSVIEFTQIINK